MSLEKAKIWFLDLILVRCRTCHVCAVLDTSRPICHKIV